MLATDKKKTGKEELAWGRVEAEYRWEEAAFNYSSWQPTRVPLYWPLELAKQQDLGSALLSSNFCAEESRYRTKIHHADDESS